MQPKSNPRPVPEQIFCLMALTKGVLDALTPTQIRKFRSEIVAFAKKTYPEMLEELEKDKKMTDPIKEKMIDVLKRYFAEVLAAG
jgi:F-type H+-transporting ATPase subunit alpha